MTRFKSSLLLTSLFITACSPAAQTTEADMVSTPDLASTDISTEIHPQAWPKLDSIPLNPEIEARIDELLSKMTLEQKVGQIIQADSGSVTAEDVKRYRLGSVLSGGNSAPGPLPYADTQSWLDAADAHFLASLDPEGVEVAIPIIWGIDAVHGHANLTGATIFPHNIGLGAANDPDLIEAIAEATALELLVSGHDWTFAPTLAVPRNDRWGRTYEGFSEDSAIVKAYGGRIVEGLQGKIGTDTFMATGHVISSAKHFVGDGGTHNGVDQGDAKISEKELRDIHTPGYITALDAGVQTVMASFSSWNGIRMHGNRDLLTDVLKGQMGFQGFVVGDWNGHGLILGCTATDCPQSLNDGLDMYMAPDSWKGLYESTLRHAQNGTIPMERLDDAVRRILRVKAQSGILDAPRPSERPYAGRQDILGSDSHRSLARKAVRASQVLLKNDGNLLPLEQNQTVFVVGDGADSISKASGGWTLSWQGGGYENSDFPNGQSILGGIRDIVETAGGTVIYDPTGESEVDADIVIAVYGEDPYAEFQGDIDHLDFRPQGFDTERLEGLGADGTPVVSVFLSGRPLWTNPEFNDSDAFIASFLPGSEGGGVADLLFQADPAYDFTGRLSFSWPKDTTQTELNYGTPDYDPLFALGYGLSYRDNSDVGLLPEQSGLSKTQMAEKGVFFEKGTASAPWMIAVDRTAIPTLPHQGRGVRVSKIDHNAQEDALLVAFSGDKPQIVSLESDSAHDFSRESNGVMELTFQARQVRGDGLTQFGMGCETESADDCHASLPISLSDEWQEIRLTLSCFQDRGVTMERLDRALTVTAAANSSIAIADVRIGEDQDAKANCGFNGSD